MEFNQNRLRFVHCEHLFNNVDEIKNYVRSVQYERASLYAEPMIFKYGNEKEPCIVLAIGSVGEGKFVYDTETGDVLNETYYIDFSQVERDIKVIYEELAEHKEELERISGLVENIISACGLDENGNYVTDFSDKIIGEATSLYVADKMLSEYVIALEKRHELYVKDTNTVDLTVEKGDTGVTLSADVKLGSKIFEGKVIENIIEKREDGLFTSVDLEYVEDESKLVFTINGENKKDIKLPEEVHVINGEYDTYTESLVLKLNKEIEVEGELKDEISISLAKLIDEWAVLGEESETPIVLTKEHVKAIDTVHEGIYEYQDILKADVRIMDNITKPDNILQKDSTGKFLFVDGVATNISYMRNNEKITVQQGIDEKMDKGDVSMQDDSIISYREDGLYSHIDVKYDSATNKIIFVKSDNQGELHRFEYELNSLSLFTKAYWDPTTEEIVIMYVDASNEMQEIRIPMQVIVSQFEVDNGDATVTLTLTKNPTGVDTLKADVNISTLPDNIIQDTHHSLYVKGTADNIRMVDNSLGDNVESAIRNLNINTSYSISEEKRLREEADRLLQSNIDNEIIRAKKAENDLQVALDNETHLREDGDSLLTSELNDEIARATRVEGELRETLVTEIERAKSEEKAISEKLESEVYRLDEKDSEINNALLDEIARAKDAERTIAEDLKEQINVSRVVESQLRNDLNEEIIRSTTYDETLNTKIENEILRSTTEDDKIKDELLHLELDLSFVVKDSGTIDLTKTDEEVGSSIIGRVKVSGEEGNLINQTDEPLYAYVDLVYNEGTNQLTLKRSGNVDKVITLSEGSVIQSITYDEITRELVILYEDSYNNIREVRVDLTKLFNPWVVESNHLGAVQLTKTVNYDGNYTDKLTAEVVISTLNDNMLINDNGTLHVSNRASNIILEDGRNVSMAINDLEAKDIELQKNIENEATQRELADKELETAISEEKTRAEAADKILEEKINANTEAIAREEARAKEVEFGLRTDVDILKDGLANEIVRAENAEHALSDNIKDVNTALLAEVKRSTEKDDEHDLKLNKLSSDLNSEIERAKSSESTLETMINAEIDRAEKAEHELSDSIGDVLNQLNVEIERSTRVDGEHDSKLNELSLFIANEETRAINKETQLEQAIAEETRLRVEGDNLLNKALEVEITRALGSEATLDANITNNRINLENEIKRAIEAETQLRNDIDAETVRANEADAHLNDLITSYYSELTKADADLQSSIATEKGRAETAEANLAKDIAALRKDVDGNTEGLDNVMKDVEEVVKTYAMSVEDTNTVDLTKKSIDAGGFIVSADVKVSNTNNNIIKVEGDGLYSNVDLTYESNNNTLYFFVNGVQKASYALNSLSTIDSITYDSVTNEIVIKYVSNGEIKETRFSATKLFKPIKVDNNGHNVILSIVDSDSYVLSADADLKNSIDNTSKSVKLAVNNDGKLTAEVNVSKLPDNILTIDNQYNLYVKGDGITTTADKVTMINKEYGDTVEVSIDKLGDLIDELENKFEDYYQEDLVNSMNQDIINLKSKTNINAIDTPSIDFTFLSTENSSSLKANIVLSDDPHNLLEVYSDRYGEFISGTSHESDGTGNFIDDTYDGVLFDGNIDYLTFETVDISGNTGHWINWTRHLQLKRNEIEFATKAEALAYLYSQAFLADKKDGEPLIGRYLDASGKTNVLIGFVKDINGYKSINTIDSVGTIIDKLEYHADSKVVTTTDEFGNVTTTHITPESLYLEYTDASSLKHTIVTPLKELIEEYLYPEAKATYDGKVVTESEMGYVVDGIDNSKEILDENGNPIYVETEVRQYHNVNFDIERHEDGKSIIKADVDFYDCGEY